jgi:hypothetical protein
MEIQIKTDRGPNQHEFVHSTSRGFRQNLPDDTANSGRAAFRTIFLGSLGCAVKSATLLKSALARSVDVDRIGASVIQSRHVSDTTRSGLVSGSAIGAGIG